MLPVLLIPPSVIRWKPNWLGGVIAFAAAMVASGAAALVLAYLLSDVTGTVTAGQALGSAIGKWGVAAMVSPFVCIYALMRRR